MSILIKGIEMPKTCAECRLCEGDTMDGLCHAVSKWFDDEYFRWYQYEEDDIDESKPVNCPLVEVPTPHGRLIDADALYMEIIEEGQRSKRYKIGEMWELNAEELRNVITSMTTIIEAEGKE